MTSSLSKQPKLCYSFTGFPTKLHLRNEHQNSILMKCHYPDLGSRLVVPQFDKGSLLQTIRSTTQIWYGISAFIPEMSFGRETYGGVPK